MFRGDSVNYVREGLVPTKTYVCTSRRTDREISRLETRDTLRDTLRCFFKKKGFSRESFEESCEILRQVSVEKLLSISGIKLTLSARTLK